MLCGYFATISVASSSMYTHIVQKRKEMFRLIKNLFLFFTRFSILIPWRRSFIILFSFHTFETRHSKNTTPSLFIKVVKIQRNEEYKKPNVIRVCVLNMQLGQLIASFCNFFLNDFTIWFLLCLKNLNMV